MLSRLIFPLLLGVWLAGGPLHSQEDSTPADDPLSEEGDTARIEEREAEAPRRRNRSRSPRWLLDASVSGVYDSNIRNSRDGLESYGSVLEAGLRFENRRSFPTLVLDYEIAGHTYTNTDTWDRVSHRGLASYIRRFDDNRWRWETMAWAYLGGVTVFDRELVDRYMLLSRLDRRLGSNDRLRVYGALRRTRYRESTAGDASSPYIGAELRHDFSARHRAEIGYRYEENDAESERLDYSRSTVSADYDFTASAQDRLSFGLAYRHQSYPNRLVSDESTEVRAEDRWSPRIRWVHSFSPEWQLQTDFGYDERFSNDPSREYSGQRLELLLRRQWDW